MHLQDASKMASYLVSTAGCHLVDLLKIISSSHSPTTNHRHRDIIISSHKHITIILHPSSIIHHISHRLHQFHQSSLMYSRTLSVLHVFYGMARVTCQDFAPLGLYAREYTLTIVIHASCRYDISWEIDPWLHALGPAHFHLISHSGNPPIPFGVQHATPKGTRMASVFAGQSEL